MQLAVKGGGFSVARRVRYPLIPPNLGGKRGRARETQTDNHRVWLEWLETAPAPLVASTTGAFSRGETSGIWVLLFTIHSHVWLCLFSAWRLLFELKQSAFRHRGPLQSALLLCYMQEQFVTECFRAEKSFLQPATWQPAGTFPWHRPTPCPPSWRLNHMLMWSQKLAASCNILWVRDYRASSRFLA